MLGRREDKLMADASARHKTAVTPRQLLLIAVLGVVLAVVLIVQFGPAAGRPEGGQRGPGTRSAAPATAGPSSPQAPSGAKPAAGEAPSARAAAAPSGPPGPPWPKLSAEAAGQYDPFAMPEPLARQAAAQGKNSPRDGKGAAPQRHSPSHPALVALRSKGTGAVLRDRNGAVAVIDNRVVRVGDVLQGYRVVSIDDDGVLLAPSDSQDAQEDRK
jgi:hypothetical protein